MTMKTESGQDLQMALNFSRDLLRFIEASPTPFHAVENARIILESNGYTPCSTDDEILGNGCYVFSHNDSSLIAVSLNEPVERGFSLVGAHTDSPCLKIKPNAAYKKEGYLQLGVEVYGGALLSPWFDRDLSIAGRVTVSDHSGKLRNRLIDFKRPVAVIPSLAIHLNRDVNDTNPINPQHHMPPVLDLFDQVPDFKTLLMKQLNTQYPEETPDRILAFELALYDTQPPATVGLNQNLIASARLDNLLSSYVGLRSLLDHNRGGNCVLVLSDHEEIGSSTASGAAGPFLESVLRRVCGDETRYRSAIERSMLVSADNAHALHPNYADKHEPNHQPLINSGPVIKINHNQRYATNSETQAVFAQLCEQEGIPCQQFVVRSDMGCGSTIGPITATELGIRTVDVGAPQLAMHSIRELAGVKDSYYLLQALTAFYNRLERSIS